MQTRTTRIRRTSLLALAWLVAACSPGAVGPTPTAPPSAPPSSTAGPPATPAPSAAPGESAGPAPSLGPGDFLVSLGGPRTGAGEYQGTADILCTSTPTGAATLWTATALPLGGDVISIGLQMNASGWVSVSVELRGQGELGPWFARSDAPGQSAEMTVARSGSVVRLQADGTFSDTAGRTYTVSLLVACSEVY